ncbi:Uncharacterized protein FWK35_00021570 [Aphis craccivora]|uniref:Uncharacterized protein n=1 Tax=Aphis craccivora TaxID=307492 RepID=A0A6G0YFN8_APHCR|nr:Uncharacterized protein FWK35_00021570 [Aphis craccivora]
MHQGIIEMCEVEICNLHCMIVDTYVIFPGVLITDVEKEYKFLSRGYYVHWVIFDDVMNLIVVDIEIGSGLNDDDAICLKSLIFVYHKINIAIVFYNYRKINITMNILFFNEMLKRVLYTSTLWGRIKVWTAGVPKDIRSGVLAMIGYYLPTTLSQKRCHVTIAFISSYMIFASTELGCYTNVCRSLIAYLYEGGCAYRSLVDFYKMNYKKKLLQVLVLDLIKVFNDLNRNTCYTKICVSHINFSNNIPNTCTVCRLVIVSMFIIYFLNIITFWGTASQKKIRKLQIIQSKFLKIALKAPWLILNKTEGALHYKIGNKTTIILG